MKTLAFAVLVATAVHAQEPSTPPAAPKRTLLKYTPPKTAGTGLRTDGDGGSRPKMAKLPSLYVLAPDHVGFTTQEQASLFWFQSGPAPKEAAARLEVTLVDPKNPKPLLKVGTALAEQSDGGAGIRRIQLARHNVTLEAGVPYKWSVAIVSDVNSRSKDVLASGVIERIAAQPELAAALDQALPDGKAAAYASAGIWYDALAALSDRIDAAPADAALRRERADLLEQAGLKAAAEFERKK